MENLKRNQNESLELESAMIEMKISLEGFEGRFEQAQERVGEDRTMGTVESEGRKTTKEK